MTPLRDYLLDAYGRFADRGVKDRDLDRAIKVDDRDATDVYPYFCSILVSVPERPGEDLILTLHNVPLSPEVTALVERHRGTIHQSLPTSLTLPLKSSQGPAIRRLAGAIRSIVGRGRRYKDPNLKWICHRTAASLERLAEHLAMYREELWPDEPHSRGPYLDPRSERYGARAMAPGPQPHGRVNKPARVAGQTEMRR